MNYKTRYLKRGGRFHGVWLAAHGLQNNVTEPDEDFMDICADLSQLLNPSARAVLEQQVPSLRFASTLIAGATRRHATLADQLLQDAENLLNDMRFARHHDRLPVSGMSVINEESYTETLEDESPQHALGSESNTIENISNATTNEINSVTPFRSITEENHPSNDAKSTSEENPGNMEESGNDTSNSTKTITARTTNDKTRNSTETKSEYSTKSHQGQLSTQESLLNTTLLSNISETENALNPFVTAEDFPMHDAFRSPVLKEIQNAMEYRDIDIISTSSITSLPQRTEEDITSPIIYLSSDRRSDFADSMTELMKRSSSTTIKRRRLISLPTDTEEEPQTRKSRTVDLTPDRDELQICFLTPLESNISPLHQLEQLNLDGSQSDENRASRYKDGKHVGVELVRESSWQTIEGESGHSSSTLVSTSAVESTMRPFPASLTIGTRGPVRASAATNSLQHLEELNLGNANQTHAAHNEDGDIVVEESLPDSSWQTIEVLQSSSTLVSTGTSVAGSTMCTIQASLPAGARGLVTAPATRRRRVRSSATYRGRKDVSLVEQSARLERSRSRRLMSSTKEASVERISSPAELQDQEMRTHTVPQNDILRCMQCPEEQNTETPPPVLTSIESLQMVRDSKDLFDSLGNESVENISCVSPPSFPRLSKTSSSPSSQTSLQIVENKNTDPFEESSRLKRPSGRNTETGHCEKENRYQSSPERVFITLPSPNHFGSRDLPKVQKIPLEFPTASASPRVKSYLKSPGSIQSGNRFIEVSAEVHPLPKHSVSEATTDIFSENSRNDTSTTDSTFNSSTSISTTNSNKSDETGIEEEIVMDILQTIWEISEPLESDDLDEVAETSTNNDTNGEVARSSDVPDQSSEIHSQEDTVQHVKETCDNIDASDQSNEISICEEEESYNILQTDADNSEDVQIHEDLPCDTREISDRSSELIDVDTRGNNDDESTQMSNSTGVEAPYDSDSSNCSQSSLGLDCVTYIYKRNDQSKPSLVMKNKLSEDYELNKLVLRNWRHRFL